MKRCWLSVAGVLVALTLVACPSRQQEAKSKKVVLIMKALSNPFFTRMADGAREYAQKLNVDLAVVGIDKETDVEKQIALIEMQIVKRIGAIVIAPADSKAVVGALKKAQDKGIIVINIDNPLDNEVMKEKGVTFPFVGSDNKQGAKMAGKYLVEKLGGTGKVALLEGIPGVINAELRKAGFLEACKEAPGIEVVADRTANWHTEEAFAVFSNMLTAHPDINGVFAANDNMALGAVQAIKAKGLTGKIVVAGYDNLKAAQEAILDGSMLATIEQNPELMGGYGVELAKRALDGEKIADYTPTPLDLITKETLEQGKQGENAMSSQSQTSGAQAQDTGTTAPTRVPLILDTDIGDDIDDTWALAMLLGSPQVNLKLIVTSTDDTETKARLVAKILEKLGRIDVPIGTGVKTGDRKINQAKWLGEYSLSNYRGTIIKDGVQAAIDLIKASPSPITILAIGPETNLKEALRRDPSIATNARVVAMAGSIAIGYNGKKGRDAEYNVMRDVEAARAVYSAPWEITIAPLDVCGTLILEGARYENVKNSNAVRATTVIENYDLWANRSKYPAGASSVLYDTVAAYLTFSDALCEMETVKLVIDDKGRTIPDEKGRPVRCALRWKDRVAFEEVLVRALTTDVGA
jgi:ABC-type sugar transport system substrate-binding protein/inosine-uridine nucleoside N-ribohydrolase